jgi:hypothetical protein
VLLEVEQRVEADCAGKTMQLFVRTISNNTISLKMDPSSTVADLMDQIYKSEGTYCMMLWLASISSSSS